MERTLETALVLVLRDAAPFDAVVAEHFPGMVAQRIPFHVTLLYPFVPRDELTDTVLGEVRGFFPGRPLGQGRAVPAPRSERISEVQGPSLTANAVARKRSARHSPSRLLPSTQDLNLNEF